MPTSPPQAKKPLSAKDHLRLASNIRVDHTGQIIPGAFHVQNGRTRQRPQVSADNYTPYLAREENEIKPPPLRVPAAPPAATMFMSSEEGLATATPVFMNAPAATRTKPQPLPLWEVERIKEEAEQNAQQKVESNAVAAEEYDEDAAALDKSNLSNANSKKKRRRCIILTFLLLAVIIAITVLLILLLPKDNTEPETSKAIGDIIQPTSEAPTAAPTSDLNVTNYVCQNATLIQEGTIMGSTLGAYNDIAIPVCSPQIGSNGIGVWYILEGDNQVWTVSLCQNDTTPSAFDTQISVFQGASCDTMQCRAANDQFCGDTSQVTFTANINQFYYVYVHGYRQQRGMFQLNAYVEPQDYYQCDKAKEAAGDDAWNELVGSTYELEQAGDADEIPKLSCTIENQLDTVNSKSGLWYTLVGTGNNMTVSSCSDTATYDAEISIIVANDNADSCASDYSCTIVQHESCPTNIGRIVSFPSIINQTYYAIVHGPEDDASSSRKRALQNSAQTADQFEVGITIVDNVPQGTFIYKPRERCQDAVTLQFDDTSFNKTVNVTGTIQPSPPLQFEDNPPFGGSCDDAVYGMSPGLWYKVVGNGRSISATTCHPDTNFDTQITVFTGACNYDDDGNDSNDNDPATLLSCHVGNDQSFCGDQSFVQWQTQVGETYRILVHGYGPRVGDFVLTLETDSTIAPSVVPSITPSVVPSMLPSASPSSSPTATPTKRPSSTYPTRYPTLTPTITASISPTLTPTGIPSQSPSTQPSSTPSAFPSKLPSSAPSILPSISPSRLPTPSPSMVPTTDTPSQIPSQNPTTASPTSSPSFKPSSVPTLVPTLSPTKQPSSNPTSLPTGMPTVSPSSAPSSAPSPAPSPSPTRNVYEVEEACGNSGSLEVDGSAEVGVIAPVPDFLPLGVFQGQCSDSTYSNPWGAWYKIEGNDRLIAADSCSQLTSVRLQFTVFSGSCGNLQCIAGNDSPCGFVWWEALRGVTYYIFVHPVNPGESGTYLLNLQDQDL